MFYKLVKNKTYQYNFSANILQMFRQENLHKFDKQFQKDAYEKNEKLKYVL